MLELLICSMLTIVPDYLIRRYVQGKRIGREITLYSVWYELRWGITACLFLTITLITTIFYFHPSTAYAASYFRSVPILTEGSGRVEEVYVGIREKVSAGQKLFRLDSTVQEAELETASRRIAEVEAEMEVARTELAADDGAIHEARNAYQQAKDEYDTRVELRRRNADAVAAREVERLQLAVEQRQGSLDAALANKKTTEARIAIQLPSEKASAEAAFEEAQAALAKTMVYAGVDGRVEQFTLRPGDIVNPFMRPAGVLIPAEAGRRAIIAGFGQIEAQVIRPGLIGEAACISKPMRILPLVVTEVQDAIAAGQIRPGDQLIDPQQASRPGSLTVFLEPLYDGVLDGLTPGSSCIVNVYTSNHERYSQPGVGTGEYVLLHAIDTVGVVHAMILRIQAVLLPVQTLVLGGH